MGFFFLIRHIANEVISGEKVLITFLSNLNRSLLRLVSQMSIDIWVRLGESWIHWIMGCCAAGACAGGGKSAS